MRGALAIVYLFGGFWFQSKTFGHMGCGGEGGFFVYKVKSFSALD
jgi:hypothetical protein